MYKEFFSQGDLEKAMGKRPLDMMDRERACIPDLQIDFLDHICVPLFRSVVQSLRGQPTFQLPSPIFENLFFSVFFSNFPSSLQ